MHVLITRPEPDASRWRDLLAEAGIASTTDPMLDIELAPSGAVLSASQVAAASSPPSPQALVITSRNSVRWLATATDLAKAQCLPAYTVGPGSAAAMRRLGFHNLREGAETAQTLIPVIMASADPAKGPVLHLSGDKIAFDLAPELAKFGLSVERRVVYRSRPSSELAPQTIRALRDGLVDTVVLLSPLSARTFVKLLDAAGLSKQHQRLVYICLSTNIAEVMAPTGPRATIVAAAPNAEAMLGAVKSLAAAQRAC